MICGFCAMGGAWCERCTGLLRTEVSACACAQRHHRDRTIVVAATDATLYAAETAILLSAWARLDKHGWPADVAG